MLVLSRGPQDKVVFPNLGISVEILRVSGNKVRIGVDAPDNVRVLRHELVDTLGAQLQAEAAKQGADDPAAAKRRHDLRNRLNTAHLGLSLVQKQLEAGLQDDALESLARAITQLDRIDSEQDPPAKPPATPPRRRALLVEDDQNESELLAGYLRLSGFEVDTAADGLQALVQLARQDRPDMVLLDMNMPRMNGRKTIDTIRANPDYRGVKVFAVTGEDPGSGGVEIGPRGVDRWFTKPIKPGELVREMSGDLEHAGH
ncbi:DNA-binding response regulator MtrA [Pirellulimonas nuda]|uniref:Translational regulator CsrA n=1 Tax=Pirellulimonas nuda TaxID=2528009 RepID=A0A518D6V8_9BACT|nr:response regulator [Pirellulimonas nuda]QDU87207.1 DNA-binding response regulator MtrA [Pirellulimonas nuda]